MPDQRRRRRCGLAFIAATTFRSCPTTIRSPVGPSGPPATPPPTTSTPGPGDLAHLDVKKLGRIPDGARWRAHGRSGTVRGCGIGYDRVHTAIDDHGRLAYAEVHPDEKGSTAVAFLHHSAAFFVTCGITRIEGILTDNARCYHNRDDFGATPTALDAHHKLIRPRCP